MNGIPQEAKKGIAESRNRTKYYFPAILIFITLILQTSLLSQISLLGLKPELHLILACYFLLHLPRIASLAAVFVLGLVIDAYSLTPFGLTPLSFMIIAAVLDGDKEDLPETNILTWSLVLAGATIFNGFLNLVVLRLTSGGAIPILEFSGKLLFLTSINTSLGACLFPLLFRSRTDILSVRDRNRGYIKRLRKAI